MLIVMNVPEILSVVGFLALGFSYIYIQWKSGGSKASTEVIGYYKEQAEVHTQQITKLTAEMGEMRGQLSEKDKRIDLLTKIVENRNPEMQQFMSRLTKSADVSEKHMQDTANILGEIKRFMEIMAPTVNNPDKKS